MRFTDFDIDPRLHANIEAMGFTQPTPIQVEAIPPGLEGRDLLGCAETGTGKTAAFLLPTLTHLLEAPRSRQPRALVLVPTRELAIQVAEHAEALSRNLPLSVVTVYGGVPMVPQTRALERGADIIVATPGRFLDHLRRGHMNLADILVLVLDEADRMLDIGFLPDIRKIVRETPEDRQTMLFTATIAPIYGLAREVTWDPVRLEVATTVTPEAIEQSLFPVMEHRKLDVLAHLLDDKDATSVLVFCRTRNRADRIGRTLIRAGVSAMVIHGDRTQQERIAALESFRENHTRVLVATDIAARGLDVTGISHVVNYDLPMKAEDYVHRIGRTGRADATGEAWSLVTPQDEGMVDRIQRIVKRRIVRRGVEGVDAGRPVEPPAVATKSPLGNAWRGRPSRRRH